MSDDTNRNMHESNKHSSDQHSSDNPIDASTDQTVREAFNDLNRRAVMIPTDGGPHKNRTPKFNRDPGRRPLVPALAFAAVAAVAAGSVGLWQRQDDDPAVNVAAEADSAEEQDDGVAAEPANTANDGGQATNDGSSDEATSDSEETADTDDGADSSETVDDGTIPVGDVNNGDRFRVDTERIQADTGDPFLNVRAGAGVDQTLLAKLPPGYRGLEATGATEDVDGQTWIEVSLMNPVAFNGSVESPFDRPTGWLSGALVLPLADGIAVGQDEVPTCRGDQVLTAAGDADQFHVAGLESTMITDDCLRVVMTLAEGSAAFEWGDDSGAYGLPNVGVVDASFGAHLDLSATGTAWPGATDTDDGVFIVRDGDEENASSVCPRSCLDLRVLRPVESVSTTMLPDLGMVVVDVELSGTDNFDPNSPVHLTGELRTESGAVITEGIARPFEASVGVKITDGNSSPVSARYSGGSIGDIEGEQYGVDTTDWIEAWGLFNFRAEGLAPGDYTMIFDAEGGADTPTLVEVPFTITE